MIQHKSIGMTGSRRGLSKPQKEWLADFLTKNISHVLHHGDCVGADDEVATEFSKVGTYIIAHPGNIPNFRAQCKVNDLIMPALPNLVRNRYIVKSSNLVLAFPDTVKETPHSGTWFTIDYATKKEKPLIIVRPNGLAVVNEYWMKKLDV